MKEETTANLLVVNIVTFIIVFFAWCVLVVQSNLEMDKSVDSKLQALVNFLLQTKISNHSIDYMTDIKHLAIVNFFALLKKFTKAKFDCTDHIK